MPFVSGIIAIAITPDGSTAYVTDNGDGTVTPIDIATDVAGSPIAVGRAPAAIAITPDGSSAYVVNQGDGTVTHVLLPSTPDATIAVGAISEADHVNSIIAAGRADLCAIARPHLADPAWTIHEATRIGAPLVAWPKPYASARAQYEAPFARAAAAERT